MFSAETVVLAALLTGVSWTWRGPSHGADDYSTVLSRMTARDQTVHSLLLAFTSREHLPNASEGCPVETRGWWLWTPDSQATAGLSGCPAKAPSFEHVAWDGTTARQVRAVGSWSDLPNLFAGKFPAIHDATLTTRRSTGLLSHMDLPSELGLFFVNTQWSAYLSRFSNVHEVGRATVAGRDCMVIIGDMDGRKEDAAFTFPWRMCIDDKNSLLVLSVESFSTGEDLPARVRDRLEKKGWTIELDGKRWYGLTYEVVDELAELQPGIWIGIKGTSGFRDTFDSYVETLVDTSNSYVNRAVPSEYVDLSIPDGTLVNNTITGRKYYAGHEGDASYEANRTFQEHFADAAPEAAAEWSRRSGLAEPFTEASENETTVYALLLLSKYTLSLREFLDTTIRIVDGDHELTPERLAESIRAVGCEARILPLREARANWPGSWLAYVDHRPGRSGQIQLFREIGDGQGVLYQPLKGFTKIDWGAIEGLVQRHVVLVPQGERRKVRQGLPLGVVLCAGLMALSALGMLWAKRRSGMYRAGPTRTMCPSTIEGHQ
jgi:hypothetical protein